jgi:hypothetical protein
MLFCLRLFLAAPALELPAEPGAEALLDLVVLVADSH